MSALSGGDAAATVTPPSGTGTNASKNLRGLNKPKCIKCGNVARSRCPFQSCKNCCAKAQNPCHIHVLKGSSSLPDKLPSSSSPKLDLQSNEASHPGNSHRVASFRQLSQNFAQFNNLQSPLRSRKPMTVKDARTINEWRFSKLKEFRDRNIELENEAFDRYMRNVSLLEEVFSVNSTPDDETDELSSMADPTTITDDNFETIVHGLKLRLRSNSARAENLRKRMQFIVDEGLKKLRKPELNDGTTDIDDPEEPGRKQKKIKTLVEEKASALSELNDKLNKARNEEDLNVCREMALKIFNPDSTRAQTESGDVEKPNEENAEGKNDSIPEEQRAHPLPKWVTVRTLYEEDLRRIDAHFCSLEDIEDL